MITPRSIAHAQEALTQFQSRRRSRSIRLIALAIVAAGLAACQDTASVSVPDREKDLYVRDVSGGIHDTIPVRGVPEPLILLREGNRYQCSMCHNTFLERRQRQALKGEHKDLTFSHGGNVQCLNCHNAADPDTFIDHEAVAIPAAESSVLCGQCHQSHLDEWRIGVHGRINGYWSSEFGERKRTQCIQCHDPHHPTFKLMTPEPPPVLTRFDLGRTGRLRHDKND